MKGFKKFFLIYTLSLLVIATGVLGLLYGFLSAYEKSLPRSFVENYLSAGVPKALEESIIDSPEGFLPPDGGEEFIQKLYNEAVLYKVSDSEYALLSDEKEFGRITLENTKGSFGFEYWKLKEESYFLEPWYDYTEISVPSGYSVYVNGKLLDGDNIVSDNFPYSCLSASYQDYPWLPMLVSYRSDAHLGSAELSVLDADGKQCTELSEAYFLSNCDDETFAKIESFCHDFIYRYMVFVGNTNGDIEANYNYFGPLIKSGGQLHRLMSQTLNILGYANTTSWEILEIELKICSYLGNGRYLADIRYQTEITALGEPDIADNFARLIIFMEDDGDMKTEAMYNYNE